MAKKSFFSERAVKYIQEMQVKRVFHARGLVSRILDLNPSEDAIELRFPITPGGFHKGGKNGAEASRKCYKHGDFIALSQPKGQQDAYNSQDIPLQIRARDFVRLRNMKEEEINFVGYTWYPVQGKDRRKRVVPFVWLPEAARIFAYSEKSAGEIKVSEYDDSKKVMSEGANVIFGVPSRTEKQGRYNIELLHVPIRDSAEKRAVVWSLSRKGDEPAHSIFNIRYTSQETREGSDILTFYPHDIAAYLALVKKAYTQDKNLTPLEMNPFSLPSKLMADFYTRLGNNILIYDPTLSKDNKLRKLHIDEKSILIARSIGVLGHDATMFWNGDRDGAIKDYDWSIPRPQRSQ
jgi:hypothetical protein